MTSRDPEWRDLPRKVERDTDTFQRDCLEIHFASAIIM